MKEQEFLQVLASIDGGAIKIDLGTVNKQLMPVQWDRLIDKLISNHTAVSLILDRQNVGIEGARNIARLLQKNDVIQELSIKIAKLGNAEAVIIAEALKAKPDRRLSLYLDDNQIEDAGALALIKARLLNPLNLQLDKNKLSSEVKNLVKHFANTIKQLQGQPVDPLDPNNPQRMPLAHHYLDDELAKTVFAAIDARTTITALDLGSNLIGDGGIPELTSALGRNKSITSLNLRANFMSQCDALEQLALAWGADNIPRKNKAKCLDLSLNYLHRKNKAEAGKLFAYPFVKSTYKNSLDDEDTKESDEHGAIAERKSQLEQDFTLNVDRGLITLVFNIKEKQAHLFIEGVERFYCPGQAFLEMVTLLPADAEHLKGRLQLSLWPHDKAQMQRNFAALKDFQCHSIKFFHANLATIRERIHLEVSEGVKQRDLGSCNSFDILPDSYRLDWAMQKIDVKSLEELRGAKPKSFSETRLFVDWQLQQPLLIEAPAAKPQSGCVIS